MHWSAEPYRCMHDFRIHVAWLTVYCIAGKFGGELNLAVWRISQPTSKLKIANIKLFLYFAHEGDRTSRCK